MSRRRGPIPGPSWFDGESYRDAEKLDRGDWLLNLVMRRWLHDEPQPEFEALLRDSPILRRDEWSNGRNLPMEFWGADVPRDVIDALRDGSVRSGIEPLTVSELYLFERRLPSEVRQAGAVFTPGATWRHEVPAAFNGTLDDAFGAEPNKQMTGRFVRIDLTLPDDVLMADLRRYLKSERARLAALGGPQPYREAAALNKRSHPLGTLAGVRSSKPHGLCLLQYLDLDRWQRAEGLSLSFDRVRQMAGCDKERAAELRRYAGLATNQLQLHAWFGRLERSVKVTPKPRKHAG